MKQTAPLPELWVGFFGLSVGPGQPEPWLFRSWLPRLDAKQNRERARLEAFLIEDRRVTGLCNSLAEHHSTAFQFGGLLQLLYKAAKENERPGEPLVLHGGAG